MPTDPQTGKEVALHCVDLTPGSKEYNKVLREFDKTMAPAQTPSGATFGGPMLAAVPTATTIGFHQPAVPNLYQHAVTYKSIVRIQRIQNPMLYFQYIVIKKDMEKHNPPGHQNEKRLFHGTPANACPKINQQGFNRSFAGKNGETLSVFGISCLLNHNFSSVLQQQCLVVEYILHPMPHTLPDPPTHRPM